jgi:hypothetical protein
MHVTNAIPLGCSLLLSVGTVNTVQTLKAFAKMLGGYDKLDGGNILFALHAFTGDPVYSLKKNGKNPNAFFEHDLVMKQNTNGKAEIYLEKEPINAFGPEDVFMMLKKFAKKKAVMGAGTAGTDEGESTAENGLVRGHAYSILDVQDPATGSAFAWNKKRVRLVKLRNPWGKFEWTGEWSDKSSKWGENGKIAKKLRFQESDDGMFWMTFDDFFREFSTIDLCDRSTGFRDIALHSDQEHYPTMGPCVGCTKGCVKFWCGCEGLGATCCGHRGHNRDLRSRKFFIGKVAPM